MTEIEPTIYPVLSESETVSAADNLGDTFPEATSRVTNEPGSNPAIQTPTAIQKEDYQPPSEVTSYASLGCVGQVRP